MRNSLHQPACCLLALILVASVTLDARGEADSIGNGVREGAVLFEDPMTGNWRDNWFLEGEKAIIEHKDDGLCFLTPSSGVSTEDKNKYREKFDSHHAVLWTKREFPGDIRISYEFTPVKTSWAYLLYIQAQGIGQPPYITDIQASKELREVSSMDKYFDHMNLLSISFRDKIRCRRYPWNDVERDLEYDDNLVPPMVPHAGLEDGKTYRVEVEKRKKSCMLRIREAESGKDVVNYTWDLSNPSAERKVPYVENGHIGLRQMGGNEIIYRDFQVTQLPPEDPKPRPS